MRRYVVRLQPFGESVVGGIDAEHAAEVACSQWYEEDERWNPPHHIRCEVRDCEMGDEKSDEWRVVVVECGHTRVFRSLFS